MRSMKKKLLLGVVLALVAFMVIPAAAVFAGPPFPAADFGLGANALPNVMANTIDKGANALPPDGPGLGTHVAVCNIGPKNPAHSLGTDPGCP